MAEKMVNFRVKCWALNGAINVGNVFKIVCVYVYVFFILTTSSEVVKCFNIQEMMYSIFAHFMLRVITYYK